MNFANKGQSATNEGSGEIYQADGDISIVHNYIGMSKEEIILLAKELLSTKMAQLTAEAKLELGKMISEFTSSFYQKMLEQNFISHFNRFSEPSIQYSYRKASLKFCIDPNPQKKDILIDLLILKFENKDRNMDNIAADIAIDNIDKLTNSHIDLLTFYACFSIFLKAYKINNFNELGYYIENLSSMFPMSENIFYGNAFLQAAGCIRVDVYENAGKSISILKSLIWNKFKDLLQEKAIDWSLTTLLNNPSETTNDMDLFPIFSEVCARMRGENSTCLQVTPAGIMLANKNLSLKRPDFPKIKGNFFG